MSTMRNRPSRKTLKLFGWLLISVLSIVFLFVLVTTQFLHWRFDAVTTGSMSPTFKIGGVVIIHPITASQVTTGDVVTFRMPVGAPVLVTHRVVEQVREAGALYFQTRGDGVPENDSYLVPAQNVVGKVLCYLPYLGRLARFVATLPGMILFLIFPAVLLIWMEYRNITRLLKLRLARTKSVMK